MQLIDSHAHLNLGEYIEDQNTVIDQALEAGVIRIVTPGVTLESCLSAFELAEKYPKLFFCALGIHPTDAADWNAEVENMFRQRANHSAVVAIGETGLDYYWDACPVSLQHQVLRKHITLAKELKRPLILHIRDKKNSQQAYNDLLRILREEKASEIGGVMHCFSGDLAFAQASIKENFKIAFGGVLTFKNAKELQAVAKELPLKHLLIETDSPWLAPHPHRGKRNEPAYVRLVAEKLAELKGETLDEIARVTTHNARHLFSF